MSLKRIDVGILGATGIVGQEFISQLDSHPWFNLVWLAASQRSEGICYKDAAKWHLSTPQPPAVSDLIVNASVPDRAPKLIFSGLDASVAGKIEAEFANAGHTVISNARNYRMESDVPLLVPEINPEHLELLPRQATERGWSGQIVTNPNCSTIILTLALAPLQPFGIKSVNVTTLQAVSGAGYPGLSSFDMVGNVIPFISGEEEKIETEAQKIFGSLKERKVESSPILVSAHTTRVGVLHGHILMISVGFQTTPNQNELIEAFKTFTGQPQTKRLPSAPTHPIVYTDMPDRPQPRLDVDINNGMSVTVSRLRPCSVLDYKFVVLGHNTIRGAAGAALLNAELMHVDGLIV